LIDGMQGTRGQIRTGGDSAGAELQGSPPTQKPLALYSGIVTVGADGTAEISFDIPEFAGTARVMAVAWNSTKLGRATIDVTVRDPVVLTATLPRFLLNGDKGTMSFDLDNVEGAPGDYSISVKTSGPVKVTGNPTTVSQARRQAADLDGAGARCRRRGHRQSRRRHQGPERADAGAALCARRQGGDAGAGAALDPDIGQRREPDADAGHVLRPRVGHRQRVAVGQASSTALDAATILKALDRYPHGCSEQITSRAMPLLYVNDLCGRRASGDGYRVDQRIKDAIERLLGPAGLERLVRPVVGRGDDAWLDAYVTTS
jgi:uncharacterized protein YfaS (alpha-2-macroglobulin family)